MKKRLISVLILLAYIALLIKVMVFKDIPTIHIGQLMLNFAGTDTGHGPNFVPFTTIVPYLLGSKGLIIGGINIVGNIALLVPLGFLLPFVYPKITWKKSLLIAIASGLSIETMQTVLRVGIFDIDDVILNALGVMLGYGAFILFSKWVREKKYLRILIAAMVVIAAAATAFYFVYPWGQPLDQQAAQQYNQSLTTEGAAPQSVDPCNGTGGNGHVASISDDSFILTRKDGSSQTVYFSSQATIKTSAGLEPLSDLKAGEAVTLVGDLNQDGSFTVDTIVVCMTP